MSVREYVGARYVPIIANPPEWDSARTYEPLTIVLNQGDSYTSRKYVPAGIALSNDEYWALTGNFNQSLAAVVTRVDGLEQELDEIPNGIVKQTDEGFTNAATSDITSLLGNTPVARATGDATGNNISNTYARKDGTIFTGGVTHENAFSFFDSNNITEDVPPEVDTSGNAHINFRDSLNNVIGWILPRFNSAGTQLMQLASRRRINEENVDNILQIGVASDGSKYTYVTDPQSWRKCLFQNSTGVLPVDKGGTGNTSLQATRAAMGLGDTTGTLPVANGGTGVSALTGSNSLRSAMGLGTNTGALAINSGGSGMTSPQVKTGNNVVSQVNSNYSLYGAYAITWGKVCHLVLQFQKNSDSADRDVWYPGYIASDLRPAYVASACDVSRGFFGEILASPFSNTGEISFKNLSGITIASGQVVTMSFTYILA